MMWILVLLPNLLWMIGVFIVLANDEIELKKKILYLLVLQFIFMFSDVSVGKEALSEQVNGYSSMMTEVLMIGIMAFWFNKMKDIDYEKKVDKKFDFKTLVPYLICMGISIALVLMIYFFIFA